MKVKIRIEFDVEPLDNADEFSEQFARSAASQAAYDHLTLITVSGVNTDTDSVEVHAEGFGPCRVALGEDHE